MKKFVKMALCFLVIFITVGLHSENVVLQWNQAALNAIIKAKTSPPVAARALAIVHTAIFDAWAAYDCKAIGTRFEGLLRRPSEEFNDLNKSKAVSFAAYRTLLDLFPEQSIALTTFMISLGYDPDNFSTDITTPEGIGNTEAADLLLFRHGDGSNQLANEPNTIGGPYSDYTGYQPLNTSTVLVDPSLWQPLPGQICLTPHWSLVTPFALKSGNEFQRGHLATYPSKKYTQQAKEVLKLSANLTDQTKSIALYWADGPGSVTPPGHWNLFAQFVSNRDENTLDEDAKLFFALNNALLDSSIAAWDDKRAFEAVRPITAIRFLFNNEQVKAWGGPCRGTQEILGQNFQSYIPTPPFPELVSGHSTFSAAGAEVLKLFTGSDCFKNSAIVLAGSGELGCAPTKNVKLKWKTFSEAADEAGMSRRYGGIHFKTGDMEGRRLGRKIGALAFERALYFING
ncbi:MAG: phosphoesterase [Candidatus Protochlamydia sp.]|nr:phosphoesterase [Candidatus Protochlamydia sp.]